MPNTAPNLLPSRSARRAPICSTLFLLFLPAVLNAQAQIQTTHRQDASAVAILNSALTAMGGSAAWSQVNDVEVAGTCSSPALSATPALSASQTLSASANQPGSSVLWTTQGKEFRYETDTVNGGPVYLSGHGNPKIASASQNTNLAFEYGLRRLPYHLPALQIAAAINGSANFSIILLGIEPISDSTAAHIRIVQYQGPSKLPGSQQDWWFDLATGLPIRVTYLLPTEDNSRYVHLTQNFSGWTPQGTVLVPLQLSLTYDGQFTLQSCTMQNVTVNQNPTSAVFDAK